MIDRLYINTSGKPEVVSFTVNGKEKSIVLQPRRVFDAGFYGADLDSVRVNGTNIGAIKGNSRPINILTQAAYLDYETTGIKSDSAITEAAVYRRDKDALDVLLVKPYATATVASSDEELVEMTSRRNRFQMLLDVKPRSHQSVVMATHLVDEFTRAQILNEPNALVKAITPLDSDIAKSAKVILTDTSLKSHQKLEALIRLDNDKKVFNEGTGVTEEIQRYMAKYDEYQARYYVSGETQAKNVGVKGSLTATGYSPEASMRNKYVFELTEYLRNENFLNNQTAIDDYKIKLQSYLKDVYGQEFSQVNVSVVSAEELAEKELPALLKGHNVQTANSMFEATRTGVVLKGRIARDLIKQNGFESIGKIEDFNKTVMTNLMATHPYRDVLEGVPYTGNPFVTTGEEYNIARTRAMISNDFTQTVLPYVASTEAGSARDVQDLMKSTQSSLHKIGIIKNSRPHAVSVEVQARVFGAAVEPNAEKMVSALLEKEAHLAAPDVAVSTRKILESAITMNLAGKEFSEGTELGQYYFKQAKQGQGPLFELFKYGAIFNELNKDSGKSLGLGKILFRQRMARNLESILDPTKFGTYRNVEGQRLNANLQATAGDDTVVTTNLARFKTYIGEAGLYEPVEKIAKEYGLDDGVSELNSLIKEINESAGGGLFDFDADTQTYSVKKKIDIKEVLNSISEDLLERKVSDKTVAYEEFKAGLNSAKSTNERMQVLLPTVLKNIQSRGSQIEAFETRFGKDPKEVSRNINNLTRQYISDLDKAKAVKLPTVEEVARLSDLSGLKKKIAPIYLGAAVGFTAASFLDINQNGGPRKSILTPSYDDWYSQQAQFFGSETAFQDQIESKYGSLQGMQEQGVAAKLRKMMTDFGSPFQGAGYSYGVLENMQYIRERERKIQESYNFRHNSQEGDIYQLLRSFVSNSFTPPEAQLKNRIRPLLGGFDPVPTSFKEVKGNNLVKVTLDTSYKINVEDADTITLSQKGASGALGDFMGSGKKFSIRFAGIDAPETSHGDRGAQPYAVAAKRLAKDLMSKASKIELVFDPSDTTYGRRVAMVYADGKNVNLELIKRGAAAFLPYRGSGKSPIYDHKAFEDAQARAQQSSRGMWTTDYFKAYAQMMKEGNQSITFNTLVNASKVSSNTNLMNVASTMNLADQLGIGNQFVQQEVGFSSLAMKESAGGRAQVFKADLGKHMWDDPFMGMSQNTITADNGNILADIKRSMRERESNIADKLSTKRLLANNKRLANNVNGVSKGAIKKRGESNIKRAINRERLLTMEILQQKANKQVFKNQINHHRM